jgi:hypothetical protein
MKMIRFLQNTNEKCDGHSDASYKMHEKIAKFFQAERKSVSTGERDDTERIGSSDNAEAERVLDDPGTEPTEEEEGPGKGRTERTSPEAPGEIGRD